MLEEFLLNQPLGPLGPTNFLKHAVYQAVASGVSAQTIALILLFPLVAALIAAARYLVGIRGFGIFTPAMLSVAFLTIGIIPGLFLFSVVFAIATLGRLIMRKLKIHYLARMALLLWFVCLAVFGVLVLAPVLNFQELLKVSFFPILILVLLAENFVEVQIGKSLREASRMTIETFVLALGGFGVLKLEFLQKEALFRPEVMVLGIALLNLLVGRFTGLRLLEYKRFRRLLK